MAILSRVKKLGRDAAEGWRTFWYGKPCPKHPGHRINELDLEPTHGAMMGSWCALCWEEFREKHDL